MLEINVILIAFSLIFAGVSAYFSFRSWRCWKISDLDVIKARVFLDKSFLDNNFKLSLAVVWTMGGLVSLHSIMEYAELTGSTWYGFYNVYYAALPVAMLSLMLVTYLWFKLLCKQKPKDFIK